MWDVSGQTDNIPEKSARGDKPDIKNKKEDEMPPGTATFIRILWFLGFHRVHGIRQQHWVLQRFSSVWKVAYWLTLVSN